MNGIFQLNTMLLVCMVQVILCCQPGGGDPGPQRRKPPPRNPNDTIFLGNLTGWGRPDSKGMKWKNFIEYYKNISMQGSEDDGWDSYYNKKPSGFPREWEDYGPGSAGVSPPPWAYISEHYGRPDACFMFPVVGHCKEQKIRWAYNPESKACHMFYYSGCGGNENNFMYKRDCEDACTKTPSHPCEAQEKINFEDLASIP